MIRIMASPSPFLFLLLVLMLSPAPPRGESMRTTARRKHEDEEEREERTVSPTPPSPTPNPHHRSLCRGATARTAASSRRWQVAVAAEVRCHRVRHLMTCGAFVAGRQAQAETPTPQSDCCSSLATFFNTSNTVAAEQGGDGLLRCLCPVILGDVNRMLPRPVDPVRMMYLPIACGVVLPPQLLSICFNGQQQSLPLLGRIPDVWEKPSAALSP